MYSKCKALWERCTTYIITYIPNDLIRLMNTTGLVETTVWYFSDPPVGILFFYCFDNETFKSPKCCSRMIWLWPKTPLKRIVLWLGTFLKDFIPQQKPDPDGLCRFPQLVLSHQKQCHQYKGDRVAWILFKQAPETHIYTWLTCT